jgi:hypothetical protein
MGCQPLIVDQPAPSSQEITYDNYTSPDGRISFDTPAGWILTPFGGAFNLSTEGWVDANAVQPGQQQIDIMTLAAEEFVDMGAARDLPAAEYALALLQAIDDGSSPFTVDGTRTISLQDGREAGVVDITTDPAQALLMVYQEGDLAVFVSSYAHKSEFVDLAPVVEHVVNSIQLHDVPTASAEAGTNVFVIATDDGLQFPGMAGPELPGGLVTFTFENARTDAEFGPAIARLNADTTLDAFTAAAVSDNPMAAVALVTLYGGKYLQPGDSFSFATNLIPGEHVLLEMTPDGIGELSPFVVTEVDDSDSATMPTADVTLNLLDFAFGLPINMPAGEQLWHIANDGAQWHEIIIFPVPDGTTVADLMTESEPPWAQESEFAEAGFSFGPMSEGRSVWTTVNLAPGTYAALCFLPDIAGDFSPHIEHGMASVFTVE